MEILREVDANDYNIRAAQRYLESADYDGVAKVARGQCGLIHKMFGEQGRPLPDRLQEILRDGRMETFMPSGDLFAAGHYEAGKLKSYSPIKEWK